MSENQRVHELIQDIVNANGNYEYQNLSDDEKELLFRALGTNWMSQLPLKCNAADRREEADRQQFN